MRTKEYEIIIDTETCPIDKTLNAVIPENMFTYDAGWAVCDLKGNVVKTRSFIVKEIFEYEKELMQSAYYANKIPMYLADIENGTRTLATWYEIIKTFREDVAEYRVKKVYAHNMRFDNGTLNTTQRWLTKSKYRYFFPREIMICDTLKLARQLIAPMPTYKKFCSENGYLTKNGQPRLTAEIIYRFMTKDNDFVESHTGLEDVMIEKEILAYCRRKHKRMNAQMWA